MRIRHLVLPLVALGLSTSCLASTEPIVIPTIETTGFAASLGVNLASSVKTPSGMYYRDISVGSGATVGRGSAVGVYYVGALPDASIFDSRTAASGATPYTFTVGANQVIDGFDEGVVGMKVGGERQLIIPSYLAYGPNSQIDGTTGRVILPAYAILVFTVTMASAQ